MTRIAGVSVAGSWPGAVVLRSGWAKATARPWNDHDLRASLRFERGSAEFLAGCARALEEMGAPEVLSAPLHRGATGTWLRAGFAPYQELLLMEARLSGRLPDSGPVARTSDLELIARIDEEAFEPAWQIGRLGLADALAATPASTILVSGEPPVGFAIVGASGVTGFLQRLAVVGAHQGRGTGRLLVRAAMRWARSAGARTMLLNTQTDNDRATALYRSEGFRMLDDRLAVLRARPGAETEGAT